MRSTLIKLCRLPRETSCVCVILILTGIGCQSPKRDCSWWGRTWRLGDAKAITASALKEKDYETIAQRICALAQLAAGIPVYGKTPSLAQQHDAEAGLLTIQDRLLTSDWPIRTDTPVRSADEMRASLAGYMYFVCANIGVRREFYDKLRPAPNQPELCDKWQKMLAVLEATHLRSHISETTSDRKGSGPNAIRLSIFLL
jgi:hypothetical protein